MQQLTDSDLRFVTARIPKDIRDLMMAHTLFLGGGFIRETIAGQKPNDIDLFGTDKGALHLMADLLQAKRSGESRKFTTDNAITVLSPPRMPVQFITRWLFEDPTMLMESFDFTVCQAVIWFDGRWRSHIADGFYPDLAARRIVYTAPTREEEAGGSMMRVRKFLARGYTIQATSLASVIARVALGVVEEKLPTHVPREKAWAMAIGGLLNEVDPLLVVDGFEPVNEHEAV